MAKGHLKERLDIHKAKESLNTPTKKSKKKKGTKDSGLIAVEKKEPEQKARKSPAKEKKKKVQNEIEVEVEVSGDEEGRIGVSSLDEELQKDFAQVVAVDHEEEEEEEEEEDEEERKETLNYDALVRSDAEEEDDLEEDDKDDEDDEEDEEEDEEDEEEDVPYSDVEFDSDADVVPHSKTTINQTAALTDSLNRISLPWKDHSFIEHQSIVSDAPTAESIRDIYDDTERELAFYKQSLHAANEAKKILIGLKVPFSRPADYFAEMIKTDEHMDKLKQKLVHEATAEKQSEEAKKQRLLKKFGKKVQIATLQERQKQKRETLDKIKSIRKKRKDSGQVDNDEFEIALEESNAARDGGSNRKRKFDGPREKDHGNKNKKTKRPGKSKRSKR